MEEHSPSAGLGDGVSPMLPSYKPLTPVDYLRRARSVFADRVAVVDGDEQWTYAEWADRVDQVKQALRLRGVKPGDRVIALCSNSIVMLDLHYAVPAVGAVLVPLNTRLAAVEMVKIAEHSGGSLIVASREYEEQAKELAETTKIGLIVEGSDVLPASDTLQDDFESDENGLIAINYTSGTTGEPKGVMYTHRGAYMQALAMAFHSKFDTETAYLWVLPMFHCNGWTFPWAVTASGGTHVCLRRFDPESTWSTLRDENITHFCGAPTVLSMLVESGSATPLETPVKVSTGGAPPTTALLAKLEPFGFEVTHLYGLTETYGPLAINIWQSEWDLLSADERSELRARQGAPNISANPLRVIDDAGQDVPNDGMTVGEVIARGNSVAAGYYRNPEATRLAVTADGWLRTGDLAVKYPDGYIELRDRMKDIIISGGENISSLEVERALAQHPAVIECAVVARPHERWGEVPVAFVTLRASAPFEREEVDTFLRSRLAGYKVPKEILVEELPKTSTGKIRKDVLRKRFV